MLRAGQEALFEACPEYTIEEREGLAGDVFVAMLTAALDGSECLPPPDTHTYDEDPLPDKWDDEPPKVTTLYALADDELAAVNNLRAQKARALQVNMKRCQCDHNEYCQHCWPESFRPGGVWHGLGA